MKEIKSLPISSCVCVCLAQTDLKLTVQAKLALNSWFLTSQMLGLWVCAIAIMLDFLKIFIY